MISDDERREVAARLRGLDVEITSRDTLERAVDKFMKAVCGDIPFSPIRYSVRNLCGLAAMLAGLIDVPTTVLDLTETTRTVHGEEVHVWECRECGQSCEEMYGEYEYCPHCERKVVRTND